MKKKPIPRKKDPLAISKKQVVNASPETASKFDRFSWMFRPKKAKSKLYADDFVTGEFI